MICLFCDKEASKESRYRLCKHHVEIARDSYVKREMCEVNSICSNYLLHLNKLDAIKKRIDADLEEVEKRKSLASIDPPKDMRISDMLWDADRWLRRFQDEQESVNYLLRKLFNEF